MALDQALLEQVQRTGESFIRLYRWAPFCLSLGRHEPALRRYDRRAIEERGLDVVRRPTGGRAVWHARELTYAVAAPVARVGGPAQSYRRIHHLIAAGLRRLGAEVQLASGRAPAPLGAGACFASPGGGEIVVQGRKLAGSAQLRQGEGLLQHGSVLLQDDQALVAQLTLGPGPTGGEITLQEALHREVGFEEVAAAIIEAIDGSLGPANPAPSVPDPVARRALELAVTFRDPTWTWRR